MKNAGKPIDDMPALSRPIVELIRAQRGQLSPSQRARMELRWLAQLNGQRGGLLRLAWASVALVASVAIFAVLVAMPRRTTPALEVSITGGHLTRDGAIETDAGKAPRVRFSDGSGMQLSATTHVTLRHVDGFGATVSMHDGDADVDVNHRTGARWVFEAGPFVIRVTGTAFRFVWAPEVEEFDLLMRRGTVEVQGPLTDGPVALRAGQHLFVHVRRGEAVIREREAENASGVATTNEPVVAADAGASLAFAAGSQSIVHETSSDAGRALSPSARPEVVGKNWPALMESGDYDAVISDARRRGLDQSLDSASAQGLAALADASRYTREDDVARRTLVAERRRFAGSTLAREAAFLLGRLDERQSNLAAALDWYKKYASEDPKGRYVSEALGRTMVLLTVSFPDGARSVADGYLRRFPSGAYAARARSLVKAP